MKKAVLIFLLTQLFFISTLLAQDATVVVPNIVGLNVPQAAAILNAVGLQLGEEEPVGWSESTGLLRGSIGGQSVDAGTAVTIGTTIDIDVLRSPNMAIVYDDNDFTVINLSDSVANVTGLRFTTTEGTSASFAASRWSSSLREKQCMQMWSVNRNGPKDIDGCLYIQNWLTTTNTGEHFWTQLSGALNFSVIEDGIERASCPSAPRNSQDNPLRCEFYFSGAQASDSITAYMYLVYTPDSIALINQSNDKWMPTDRALIYNYNPRLQVQGISGVFADPTVLRQEHYVGYGDISRLAPGQCIMLTANNPDGTNPPEPCNVVAQRDLSPDVIFWAASFEIESATDGQKHECPAATTEYRTICIAPQ